MVGDRLINLLMEMKKGKLKWLVRLLPKMHRKLNLFQTNFKAASGTGKIWTLLPTDLKSLSSLPAPVRGTRGWGEPEAGLTLPLGMCSDGEL